MTEPPVDPRVSARLSRTRGRDTQPELIVRRALHAEGYRYRVNHAPLQGLRRTADIVFPRLRIAVFIDGCFWHGCPDHYVEPKTRTEFWRSKIAANVARDIQTTARLQDEGWEVLRFWEHEEPATVVASIIATAKDRGSGAPTGPPDSLDHAPLRGNGRQGE